MPGGINGADAYSELKALQRYALNNNVWQNSPKSMKLRTRNFLAGHGPEAQFKRDVALWYGAITDCSEPWKGVFLRRIFAVLYRGGLMVKRGPSWIDYSSQRIPICSAISHTARVLVQLPANDNGEFWQWLWGQENPRKRAAATHGVAQLARTEQINNSVSKSVEELKKNRNVKHYGVNIALGGVGNYYDGMFIDLTAERFERIRAHGPLDPGLIGQSGGPPVPSRQGRPDPRTFPVVIDLRDRPLVRSTS